MPAAPPITATIGIHGSASTWVFNVVRELLEAAHGAEAVRSLYSEKPEALRTGGESHLVIKSHHGSPEMDAWLAAERIPIFLSIRDPRDAAVSMMRRFNSPLQHVVIWISNDCRRLARLAERCEMLLRYESRFFDRPVTVAEIAQKLGTALPSDTLETVFSRYRTEAVALLGRSLHAYEPERLSQVGGCQMDKLTHIQDVHIGDAESGKWRRLPEPLPSRLTESFLPFLGAFGYSID